MAIVVTLDEALRNRGMKLHELSRSVGKSTVNVSRLKTGKVRAIRFSMLDGICEALDCQPGDILAYVPDAEEP
ncbi:helix-turn-helix domain-containing protein [Raoultibacter phocaeensis]|uniref:helix-turn-helix domain-containing protein n=1 Tax=Raoultibacter phocaeensis TaxID=2479841 RepID=UPI00111BB9D9|nr:helix-turn-helix transcriptional regulator [Raoultibacter phocaeensis]